MFTYKYIRRETFQKARWSPLRSYSQKAMHFTLNDISWIFENGIYIYTKIMPFALGEVFKYKIQTLRKKQDNSRSICLYTKIMTLCVTFIYIYNFSYSILWYLTMNVRTIRAIRSINRFEPFIESWSYSYDKSMIFNTYQRMRL